MFAYAYNHRTTEGENTVISRAPFLSDYLVLSCLVLSCVVLSCLVLCCLVLCCLVLCCLVLCYVVLCCLAFVVLCCVMLSCVVLSCVYVVLSCCVGRVSVDHMQAQLDHVLARGGLGAAVNVLCDVV